MNFKDIGFINIDPNKGEILNKSKYYDLRNAVLKKMVIK